MKELTDSIERHGKRKLKFYLILILVTFAVVVALVIAFRFSANFKTDGKVTAIGFENIGEFSTQSAVCTSVRVEEKDRNLFGITIPFTQSKLIYSYDTEVKAGYNFSDITWNLGDTEETSHTVYIHLPKEPHITGSDLHEDSFKVFHEDESIFAPISLEEHNQSIQELKADAIQQAIDNGIYKQAEENAKTILENFVYQVFPGDQYEIVFD